MARTLFEADKLLQWLEEVLTTAASGVDVDVVVVGRPDSRSSVQITLHDVPAPLGGLEVRPPHDDGNAVADRKVPPARLLDDGAPPGSPRSLQRAPFLAR